jgi:ADP-ribose pyrophosphatase YjhB (NUDIX family)
VADMFAYCPGCGQANTVAKQDSTNYECAACGWHFWNNAKAAVGLALLKDGKLLVVKRGIEPAKGKYAVPGGFVDFGEDAETAAIREAQEEIGASIRKEDLELLGVYPSHYNEHTFTLNIIFAVRHWEGELRAGSDAAAIAWHDPAIVSGTTFSPPYEGFEAALRQKLQASN